jgi:hypothetical protein
MGLYGVWGDIKDNFKNEIDLFGDGEYLLIDANDSLGRVHVFLTKEQTKQLRDYLNDVLEEDF